MSSKKWWAMIVATALALWLLGFATGVSYQHWECHQPPTGECR